MPMTKYDLRISEVEYSFELAQEEIQQSVKEPKEHEPLTTDEFIKKRKEIVRWLIDRSMDPS